MPISMANTSYISRVRTKWRGANVKLSQRWDGQDDGDGKEQDTFAKFLVSDRGHQGNPQAPSGQEPVDNQKDHSKDLGQEIPFDAHHQVPGGHPRGIEGALCIPIELIICVKVVRRVRGR